MPPKHPRPGHSALVKDNFTRDQGQTNGRANGNGAASTNGAARYQSEKVRVAIVGVGNCASAFVQGVNYYSDADPDRAGPGLDARGPRRLPRSRHRIHGRLRHRLAPRSARTSGEAIWAGQNNTMKFAKVPKKLGVPVYRGMTHDGLGKYLKEKIKKAPGETADIVKILKDTHTDVVVSYLPVGSEQATKWYVEQVLEAGCGFVNCIPVFIAREDYWDKRFKKARLPIVGDDIKSQVGATIVHRTLARLFADRGVKMLAHLPAQCRRQHGLLQHARARAPGVQEDLQDQRRHLDHGPPAARRGRLHRTRRTTCRG